MPLSARERQKQYRLRHPEKARESHKREWEKLKNNPELLTKHKAEQKRWRETHKEKTKQLNTEYYKKNKARIDEHNRVKSNEQRHLLKETDPIGYAKYLKRMRDAARKSYALHKDNPNYNFHKDNKQREFLIHFLGGKCVKCGYSENIHALELDHKNGWGNKDRLRIGGKHCRISRYYLKHLDEAKEKLQVLCANCNKIKVFEEREHYNRVNWKATSSYDGLER